MNYNLKINLISPHASGLTKKMTKTGKKAMINPFSRKNYILHMGGSYKIIGGLIIKRGNKFIEIQLLKQEAV